MCRHWRTTIHFQSLNRYLGNHMKIFPENTTEKIGFEFIRDATLQYALSDLARERLSELAPSSLRDVVLERLARTREAMQLIRIGEALPLEEATDVRSPLKRSRAEGSVLDPQTISRIGSFIVMSRRVRQFFGQREEHYVTWSAFTSGIIPLKPLEESIFKAVSDLGAIRDNASPELQSIRRNLNARRNDLRATLNKVLRQASKDGYLSENEPTIRGGRMVLAIRAEHKRKISGFVHDASATGQTVYLEPVEALHINNDIRQLENEEQREIERILRVLTTQIREDAPHILRNAEILGELDAGMAVARLSVELDGEIPVLSEPGRGQALGEIDLVRAYNPHLLLKAKREGSGEKIVPLDFALEREERCVVITGPNAGGKSVSLKTLGLHALMVQSGYAVPSREGSKIPVFGALFVDMGDEQSIDNDLSTFSSRLEWMRGAAIRANDQSLVLIDEAGTGTDPEEGVALYQSLLESLIDSKTITVVTTHHGNLKVFAHNHPAAVNASMEFDQATLSPTYRFKKGLPGSSYAFEIGKRMGVPDAILGRARELLGDTRNRLEFLIAELERTAQDSERITAEAEEKLRRAQQLLNEYQQKSETLTRERDKIREKALIEARDIMQSANKRVEEAVRRIAEEKAGKSEVKQIRKELELEKGKLAEDLEEIREAHQPKTLGTPPKIGDTVKMVDGSTTGELVEHNGNFAVVLTDGLRLRTKYKNLVKVEATVKKRDRIQISVVGSGDDDGVVRTMSNSLDLRGKRGEEAINELTYYLDKAMSSGLGQVDIIHGKGDGILRKLVHNYLRERREVVAFDLAPWEQGGPGCTIVRF